MYFIYKIFPHQQNTIIKNRKYLTWHSNAANICSLIRDYDENVETNHNFIDNNQKK